MDSRDPRSQARPVGRHAEALRAALRRLPAYVYLEDLIRGRHVLEVGCGDGLGAYHLARSGAASVIALERGASMVDAARARYRLANLTFSVADFSAIELGDEAVDIVCVPNGEELARWPAFLSEARRVLARDGLIIVTAPSGDRPGSRGVPYHDLVGRLEPHFSPVRMVGVTPFVGFSLIEYADSQEVLDVELDTTLCDGGGGRDPVTDYVAVGGMGARSGMPRGYMVVEVPFAEGLGAVAQAHGGDLVVPAPREPDEQGMGADLDGAASLDQPPVAAAARAEDPDIRRRLARAVEERTGAEAEVQALRARLGLAEEEIGRVAAQAARELGEARRALHVANARNDSLEAQLAEARKGYGSGADIAERDRLQAELALQADELARVQAELVARDEEVSDLRLEMAPLEVMVRAAEAHEAEMREQRAALIERDAFIEELKQEIGEVVAAQQAAAAAARDASVEVDELEQALREHRARLSAAEGELLRLRAKAAEPAPPSPGPAIDPERLADLEAQLADRTAAAEKASARWREAEGKTDDLWKKIGELQKELGAVREQAVETARQQRQAAQIALTRAVDEASRKLVSAQDQTLRTERERQELEREVQALRPKVGELEGERDQARGALAATESDLERSRAQLAALEGERDQAREALAAARAEHEALAARLEAAQAEAAGGERDDDDRLAAELEELRQELIGVEREVRAQEERAGELAARLGALASQVAPPAADPPASPPPDTPPGEP